MHTVSATELTRNTREILDRVVTGGETVTIERNQAIVAQIKPAQRAITASQALAGLTFNALNAQQANSWLQDSKTGFEDAVRDPWA